jgi:hypothetical protein
MINSIDVAHLPVALGDWHGTRRDRGGDRGNALVVKSTRPAADIPVSRGAPAPRPAFCSVWPTAVRRCGGAPPIGGGGPRPRLLLVLPHATRESHVLVMVMERWSRPCRSRFVQQDSMGHRGHSQVIINRLGGVTVVS